LLGNAEDEREGEGEEDDEGLGETDPHVVAVSETMGE